MEISVEKLKQLAELLNQFVAFLETQEQPIEEPEPIEEPIEEPEPVIEPEPEPEPEPKPMPEPEPVVITLTLDQLVDEILDGKWGSGDTREQNLEAAGYDYNVVQNRVNEILNVVQEVLDAKWGNGDARKQKLTEAGYDYEVVQNQINRQLSKENP